jgi:outer membrane protein TolC
MTVCALRPGILALLIVAGAAARQVPRYGLGHILAAAARGSAELRIARLDYEAGLQEIWFFRAEAFPGLTFSTGTTYLSQSTESRVTTGNVFTAAVERVEGVGLSWSLALRQPFVTFGRTRSALALADLQSDVLAERLELDRDVYFFSVIQGFGTLLLAQRDVAIERRALARAGLLLKAVRLDVAAGLRPRTDSLRILALAKSAEADLAVAVESRLAARRLLARLIGWEFDRAFRVALPDDSLPFAVPAPHGMVAASREVALKEYEATMMEKRIALERADLFPTISVVGSINNEFLALDTMGFGALFRRARQDTAGEQFIGEITIPEPADYFDPAFFNYAIGAELSWPVFAGGRNLAQYRQVKAQARRAREELERLRLENRIEISRAIGLVEALAVSIEALRVQLEATRLAYERVQQDYLAGFTDLTRLLDAERELQQAERALANARVRRLEAIARARLALGLSVYEAGR